MIARLDAFQRRHPAVGFPLAVFYKFFDDQGGYLAALIAYYAFVSLFPLLLLSTTVLGIVLQGDQELQQRILDSALSQFPVIGDDLGTPDSIGGGTTGLVIGGIGSLYGGLGVANAIQNAMNVAWAVPRNSRPNPFKMRGLSVVLLLIVGLSVLATTALTALAAAVDVVPALVIAASVVLNAGVFVVAFRFATARALGWRDVAPGAVVAAIAWQALQSFGTAYVQDVVQGSSATNGAFALVLGLLAFLYLAAFVVVLCVELNVVRVERLHPRALLTPFTDDVDLTRGDRAAYTGLAAKERTKGFETVDVSFDDDDAR
jgi:membrane protein